MVEFFNTLSTYIDKITTYTHTMFEQLREGIDELSYWLNFLPHELYIAGGIILVLLIVFRILGR